MKKYMLFSFNFILLYLAYQMITGWVLTALYTPNFSLMNTNSSQEVWFAEQASIIPLLSALFIATVAYILTEFISKKRME